MPGFGGRTCSECQELFWGDPNVECRGEAAGILGWRWIRAEGADRCLPELFVNSKAEYQCIYCCISLQKKLALVV